MPILCRGHLVIADSQYTHQHHKWKRHGNACRREALLGEFLPAPVSVALLASRRQWNILPPQLRTRSADLQGVPKGLTRPRAVGLYLNHHGDPPRSGPLERQQWSTASAMSSNQVVAVGLLEAEALPVPPQGGLPRSMGRAAFHRAVVGGTGVASRMTLVHDLPTVLRTAFRIARPILLPRYFGDISATTGLTGPRPELYRGSGRGG